MLYQRPGGQQQTVPKPKMMVFETSQVEIDL